MDIHTVTMVKFQDKTYTDDVLFDLKCTILSNSQTKDLFPRKKDRDDFIRNIEFATSVEHLYDCICDYFLDETFGLEKIEIIIDPTDFAEITDADCAAMALKIKNEL